MSDRSKWNRPDWEAFNDGWCFARLGYPKLSRQNPERFNEGRLAADDDEKKRAEKRAAAASAPS